MFKLLEHAITYDAYNSLKEWVSRCHYPHFTSEQTEEWEIQTSMPSAQYQMND